MNSHSISLRFRLFLCATVTAVAGLAAGWLPEFAALQATNWILFGLLALSLTLVWGQAGIFSFGQGAFFGMGAYAYGVVAINLLPLTNETFSGVIAGMLAGALLAAAVGYFMFYGRVGDVYVGIITLAMTLVLFTVMSSTADPSYRIGEALLGGYNGMAGVPPLTWPTPDGGEPLDTVGLYVVVVLVSGVVLGSLYLMLERPFGRILLAVRDNELRTQLLGFDVRFRKLAVFSLGGAIAGLAGALYAAWSMFVSPAVFSLNLAALVVIWVLVGGRTSFAGALVGAFFVEGMSATLGGSAGDATPFVLGAVLICVVLFLPQGMLPALSGWFAARTRSTQAKSSGPAENTSVRTLDGVPPGLSAQGSTLTGAALHKRFGGVRAANGATLEFSRSGVHCLIGPNGAGKSTFFNLLVGRHKPDSGDILLDGRPITRMEIHERVRCGLGIKLQASTLYLGLSVRENLWLASFGRLHARVAADQRTAEMLDWLGLSARADTLAGMLSHGEKQWLEIGMVLASDPSVVLLDEPTAGMTGEETARMAALVRRLGERVSVVVVEHDMAFVRALGVPITVFHQGSVFASGSLDELRRDERILEIYLGRHGSHAA